ncbi:MAG: hypothetical protein KTR24_01840 [Saprospiraceae bacterium]|nr:hypothetical protein [Saprospiraceae bacterium]
MRLRSATRSVTKSIDAILHRNRSILLELMGKNATQKDLLKIELDRKGFNHAYITGYYINSKNKMVHHVYDFAIIPFSDQGVRIMRRKNARKHQPHN